MTADASKSDYCPFGKEATRKRQTASPNRLWQDRWATLASLLRQRGEPAVIVDRHGSEEVGGYMLGMLPLGGLVLDELGLPQEFIDQSLAMKEYILHGRNGQLIREFPTEPIIKRFGLYRGIERAALLQMLRSKAGRIIFDASVSETEQDDARAVVTFSMARNPALILL